MALNDNGKNAAADGVAGAITHVSLHTADPGTTGTNEVSGGTPAYARKAIAFSAAAAGVADSSNAPAFDVPAGTTVTHIGFWDALTGGNFLGSGDITDEAFAAQGVYTLNDADITIS